MRKKILSILSALVIFFNLWGFYITNAVDLTSLPDGSISTNNFLGLKQNYSINRNYVFWNWLFLVLPAWFGKIDIYLVKSYDWVTKKWSVEYLTSVDWDTVQKLWDRFNSLAFVATQGDKKIVYSFNNTWTTGWQVIRVWEVDDPDAVVLEFKDNILLLKERQVLKKVEVCAGEDNCASFVQNNPDLSGNIIWDTTSPYIDRNPTWYLTYNGDAIYAYSIKTPGVPFVISDVQWAEYKWVNYDGMYNWSNYSQYYDFLHPIKISGMFLYNIERIGSVKYYNIFTSVNWYNSAEGKTVDQVVLSSIKVYPNAQLSLDELATWDSLLFSWNLSNYRVFQFK